MNLIIFVRCGNKVYFLKMIMIASIHQNLKKFKVSILNKKYVDKNSLYKKWALKLRRTRPANDVKKQTEKQKKWFYIRKAILFLREKFFDNCFYLLKVLPTLHWFLLYAVQPNSRDHGAWSLLAFQLVCSLTQNKLLPLGGSTKMKKINLSE